jgi:hypothetical protein
MEVAISAVHADMYPIVAPLELRAGIALFSPSNLFYTDGSLMDKVAGFAVHHSIDCNIGFRMGGPASVFTAELAAHGYGPYRKFSTGKLLDLDRQYELDNGNAITKNLAAYPSICVQV